MCAGDRQYLDRGGQPVQNLPPPPHAPPPSRLSPYPQVEDSLKKRPRMYTWKYQPTYLFSFYGKPLPPNPRQNSPGHFWPISEFPWETEGSGYVYVFSRIYGEIKCA